MTLRAGILAGLIACAVLLGGLWFLNNTRAGLGIKCSMLNDAGACFLYALSEPVAPRAPLPTENPAVVAERERQEAERQIQAAAERAQREADQAVSSASAELEGAVGVLASLADAAADEAEKLDTPTLEVEIALDDMRAEFEELAAMIANGSTGEFWVDDVSFQLYDVEFARDSVDFAADGVEFSAYAIDDARDSRDALARDVEAAMAALEAAQRRYLDAAPPPYTSAQAEADLKRLLSAIDDAVAEYERSARSVGELIAEADALMEQARELAASVGAE